MITPAAPPWSDFGGILGTCHSRSFAPTVLVVDRISPAYAGAWQNFSFPPLVALFAILDFAVGLTPTGC